MSTESDLWVEYKSGSKPGHVRRLRVRAVVDEKKGGGTFQCDEVSDNGQLILKKERLYCVGRCAAAGLEAFY
jgi:hypothetical protein